MSNPKVVVGTGKTAIKYKPMPNVFQLIRDDGSLIWCVSYGCGFGNVRVIIFWGNEERAFHNIDHVYEHGLPFDDHEDSQYVAMLNTVKSGFMHMACMFHFLPESRTREGEYSWIGDMMDDVGPVNVERL